MEKTTTIGLSVLFEVAKGLHEGDRRFLPAARKGNEVRLDESEREGEREREREKRRMEEQGREILSKFQLKFSSLKTSRYRRMNR